MRLALERAGDQPLEVWSRKFIIASRDARASTPAQSANFLKALRALFRWALDVEHVDVDPTVNVKALKQRTEGHHTWTADEMAAFEARWPIGTRERLAYDVLVWTGLRRGDASRLGPRHVRDGEITIATEKTGRVVTLPVLKPLAELYRCIADGRPDVHCAPRRYADGEGGLRQLVCGDLRGRRRAGARTWLAQGAQL